MTQTSDAQSADEVRQIDVGELQARFARGWHCLGLAKTFRDGKPHSIEAFGQKLVVFAGEDDKLSVLDAYCRHLGGDLSQGTIKGNQVACPFHDWRWGGDGKCTEVPYAKRVPLRARTKSWTTMEQNQQLFVWNDPEGNPPPPEVTIPRVEGAFSDEWTDWTWETIVIEGSNCREIVDNVVDMAHFFYIHYAFPLYFKNIFEGHIASQYMNSKGRPDIGMSTGYAGLETMLKSEAAYYGPSYMINPLQNNYGDYGIESVLINCHYPVSSNKFVLQYGAIVKKPAGVTDEVADKIAASFAKGIGEGFLQDVEIWKNKTKIENPLLTEEDGPVYQMRRWYEQFYTDIDQVTEEMTQRFEFEVDTTHANVNWEAEVAENMRIKAAEKAAAENSAAEKSTQEA